MLTEIVASLSLGKLEETGWAQRPSEKRYIFGYTEFSTRKGSDNTMRNRGKEGKCKNRSVVGGGIP